MSQEPKQWKVPFRWTRIGSILVEAETMEEARQKAESLDGQVFDHGAEIADWRVTGDPKEVR